MKSIFICYPKCSTCQKARKFLEEKGIEFEERHIVEQNPKQDELKRWIAQSGLPIKRFFNTSGLKYKALQEICISGLWNTGNFLATCGTEHAGEGDGGALGLLVL